MSHFPKNPWCPARQRATARRQQCRDRGGHAFLGQPFGRRATCDHVVVAPEAIVDQVAGRDAKGLLGERYGLVFKDLGTGYFGFYPMPHRDTAHTERATVDFFGDVKPALLYTDGASEFRSASTNLFMPHCTSTPR